MDGYVSYVCMYVCMGEGFRKASSLFSLSISLSLSLFSLSYGAVHQSTRYTQYGYINEFISNPNYIQSIKPRYHFHFSRGKFPYPYPYPLLISAQKVWIQIPLPSLSIFHLPCSCSCSCCYIHPSIHPSSSKTTDRFLQRR